MSLQPDAIANLGFQDVRPRVGRDIGNRPLWLALLAIGLIGFALFWGLESRREVVQAPSVQPRIADTSHSTSFIPALYVPPERSAIVTQTVSPRPAPSPVARLSPVKLARSPQPPRPLQRPEPRYVPAPSPYFESTVYSPALSSRPAVISNGPAVVFDVSSRDGTGQSQPIAIGPQFARAASAYATPSTDRTNIIAQGTLIGAALETALDSTQPGQARALVIKDVSNIGDSKILIPRGSRLFGEYRGGINEGQSRAQVIWTRMVRPDGVSIDLNSPAADPLGRSGIKGKVNTHFLERFAGALLQSTIDIGVLAASRSVANSSVVVALPSNVQGAASEIIPRAPRPTLRVKHGTRISVFVSRDLDFSGVEAAQ